MSQAASEAAHGRDGVVRVEVADEDEHRPGGHHHAPVQREQVVGADRGHLVDLGHLAGDRVVAVAVALQGTAGDHRRLRGGDLDPLGEPLALALDLVGGVGRAR